MLASEMASRLSRAILELTEQHDPAGVTMGQIVDALAGEGYKPEVVEQEVWSLLSQRRLTPNGYVCRKVRRRDSTGEMMQARSYEFLLVPWSLDLDRQLELQLGPDPAEVS